MLHLCLFTPCPYGTVPVFKISVHIASDRHVPLVTWKPHVNYWRNYRHCSKKTPGRYWPIMFGVSHRYTQTQDKFLLWKHTIRSQTLGVWGGTLGTISILGSCQSSWTLRNPLFWGTQLSESKGSSSSVGEGDPGAEGDSKAGGTVTPPVRMQSYRTWTRQADQVCWW